MINNGNVKRTLCRLVGELKGRLSNAEPWELNNIIRENKKKQFQQTDGGTHACPDCKTVPCNYTHETAGINL